MLAAVNLIAMGKNADGSAGGTTNSIDPLSAMIHKINQSFVRVYAEKSSQYKTIACMTVSPAVSVINEKN